MRRTWLAYASVPVLLALLMLSPPLLAAEEDKGPSKRELSAATYYTEQMERAAKRARGKSFSPKRDGAEAMRRVKELLKKYPKDERVLALKERIRKVLVKASGDTFEITEAMLAYREHEKALREKVAEKATERWAALQAELEQDPKGLIANSIPAPDPERTPMAELEGKLVVLSDFRYPEHEFTNSGAQYVRVGSPAVGYYFVRLSSRAWTGAYAALRRYRDLVSPRLTDSWTVVGRISGVNCLVPHAGENAAYTAYIGLEVDPIAIHLPGVIVAEFDASHAMGGRFAGEDQLESLKRASYTYTEVPPDVTPRKLVEIFATAIKEKNYDLYIACINPEMWRGPKSGARLRYYWGINQRRFAQTYAHVEPFEVGKPYVLKGARIDEDEAVFLSDEDVKKIRQHADDLVEGVEVKIKHYNARGRQVLMPNTVKLRRYEKKHGGRWFIDTGFPL
ncbi:MAG: hypothetical protein QNJ98_19590 [Planctomycetota bacterium]|nr:hypothetical protein [Planctomycetota bacterium]